MTTLKESIKSGCLKKIDEVRNSTQRRLTEFLLEQKSNIKTLSRFSATGSLQKTEMNCRKDAKHTGRERIELGCKKIESVKNKKFATITIIARTKINKAASLETALCGR